MKFSVIIPVYNVEDSINECIDSIIQQSYRDFEVILVNDGSTDRSGSICDTYEKVFQDCIRVIHTENRGAGLARKTGIENALGEVLLFIDSDDCLRKDTLELVAEQFAADSCDMVIFNASRKPDFSEAMYDFSIYGRRVFEAQYKQVLYERIVISRDLNTMWQKAVKKEVASEAAICTDGLWIKNGQDLLMSMSVLTLSKKVSFLDENLYFYRDRAGSAVHRVRLSRLDSIKTVHNEMKRYINIWGVPDLHMKHGSRIVKSWLEFLSMLMRSGKQLESSTRKKVLTDLAEDPFFRNAYEQMDIKMLRKTEAILAKWLYRKKYSRLRMAYGVMLILTGSNLE